ncbi:MAG: hypothetical protein H2172_16360 [Opitutus sp.]|jgi:hypothetical protein|nr:hypothetical protein [Opitutus sp.]MCS6245406.1 hypothetical protein [Opitutus sp.]MCS6274667.1 hypothetical protein [Opitutus sp.]MCS6275904.1 hypothetical protein [Opitutus sp.]MCS6299791.1 hypothetical protein [Opitutus sp.]
MSHKITDRPLKRARNGHGYLSICDYVGRYRRPRTSLTKGVSRQVRIDGYGNPTAFWVASIMAAGVVRVIQFSIRKNGEAGAKQLATQCRQRWLVELGVLRPEAVELKEAA